MNFADALKEVANKETTLTENGSIAYKSAGGEHPELTTLNFSVTSMRSWDEQKVFNEFRKVFCEDSALAMRWLAYLMDCRGGLGERKTSRTIMKWLVNENASIAEKWLPLIPEYGRWDSVVMLLDTSICDSVVKFIARTLLDDDEKLNAGKSISCLAKWLPSINTSSSETVRKAKLLIRKLGMDERTYRKMLSKFRSYSNVIETKISSGRWGDVNYSSVPSKANILYRNAFLKHDKERRNEFLKKVESGDEKINSATNFPHDILHSYNFPMNDYYWGEKKTVDVDQSLEALWKALPNYVNDDSSTMCVVDSSGSMMTTVSGSSCTAFEVAHALGIYFSERCHGQFKNKFITFSSSPKFVDMNNCSTLHDKFLLAKTYAEVSNTDVYKTMKLVLNTAVRNSMKQDDLPKSILIFSDMQFDAQCQIEGGDTEVLFERIEKEFADAGYTMPKVVFWNLIGGYGRSTTVPMQSGKGGVVLVSGYSPAIATMVLNGETSPFAALKKELMKPRYDVAEKTLANA